MPNEKPINASKYKGILKINVLLFIFRNILYSEDKQSHTLLLRVLAIDIINKYLIDKMVPIIISKVMERKIYLVKFVFIITYLNNSDVF